MNQEDGYSRKGFFGEFIGLFKKGLSNQIDRKLSRVLEAPLRPPGALEEVEFLSTCTRCNACSDACPHFAILKLPMQAGVAANTPYISPDTQPCLLCEDFPCIQVCEPGALAPLGQEGVAMGRALVDKEACQTYDDKVCTLCYDACPYPEAAITIDEDFHPRILDSCVGCGQCQQRCPVHPVGIRALSPLKYDAARLDEETWFGLFKKEEGE